MDPIEARLKILELTRPSTSSPDIDRWLQSAGRLEAYVLGAGHTEKSAPAETKTVKAPNKARIPAE